METRAKLLILCTALIVVLCKDIHSGEKPNIVIMLVDDLGYSDVGTFGATIIQTPNIDKLAERGIKFTQFYNNAKCGPTRVGLMTGITPHRVGLNGASGVLKDNTMTLAEILKLAGYNTLLSGKWHLAGGNGQFRDQLPKLRGFDRAYGLLTGASSFFELQATNAGITALFIDEDSVMTEYPNEPNFYITQAYSRKAVEYIKEYATKPEPFFLYIAHQAPHLPLHAPESEIQKYLGKFMVGWDQLRIDRFNKQLALGIIDSSVNISPRDGLNSTWASASNKTELDRRMSVHAAMIDIVDQGFGDVVAEIKNQGVWDNTVFMFFSDNGATEEAPNKPNYPGTIGTKDSWPSITRPWANAADTPYRKYKNWTYEGGMKSPFIISWPAAIAKPSMYNGIAHVKDVFATTIHLAQGSFPAQRNGVDNMIHEGVSFGEVLTKGIHQEQDYLVWKQGNHKAVRQGPWKAIQNGTNAWELYNIDQDPTELNNLAGSNAQMLSTLQGLYTDWETNADVPTAPKALPPVLQISGCMNNQFAEYNPYAEVSNPSDCITGIEGRNLNQGKLINALKFKGQKVQINLKGNYTLYVYDVNGNILRIFRKNQPASFSIKNIQRTGMLIFQLKTNTGVVSKKRFKI